MSKSRSFRPRLQALESRDCPSTFTLNVDAKSNIFGAGTNSTPEPSGGGGGTVAGSVAIPGPGQVVTFPQITGLATSSTVHNNPYADADGSTTAAGGFINVQSWNGISGMTHANRFLFLVGVFLSDDAPSGAGPARLSFSDSAPVTELAPQIAQTFYIGNGRNEADGTLQRYIVPAGATRLYFGFVDIVYQYGLPGAYDDNLGMFAVQGSITGAVVLPPDRGVYAAGTDAPTVRVYNAASREVASATPFGEGFRDEVRTAMADFNGDGVADLVAATGPGEATHVRILDGADGRELFALDPFEASFTGGVHVAAGDLDGDGRADLVVAPDEGGGPRCRIFRGSDFAQIADFYAIDDPNFRGGARPAVGDVNGDNLGDLIVAAGFGGGPRVAAFDGAQLAGDRRKLFGDFYAFEQTLRNGIYVAAGDVDGDGRVDLVAGGGPGGGPRVTVFDGNALLQERRAPLADFYAGDPLSRGGVRVAAKNLDGDARADLVTGSGDNGTITVYKGAAIAMNPADPGRDAEIALPGDLHGVYVG